MTIHSIEPLSQNQSDAILRQTSASLQVIARDTFFEQTDVHPLIETLICRDRDQVSDIIKHCPNLRLIFIVSTGIEKLPFTKLLQHNVRVANTGGINAPIMSEYAMAYILSQSARVCENLDNQRQHQWKKFQCVNSLFGQNLLIVGAGRTGQLLANKAKAFGMNITGVKKHPSPLANFDRIITLAELDETLPWADYIVCSIPLTPETTGLFNSHTFSLMKSTTTFINISRGGHVIQSDLIEALTESRIHSAILDVYDQEPVPSDSPLWDIPNLYMTPHSSGRLENFMDNAIQYFIFNYQAYISGMPMPNEIKLNEGY